MRLLELQVLHAIQDYNNYRKLRSYIEDDFFVATETRLIFQCLSVLQENYQRSPDWGEVRTLLYEHVRDPEKKRFFRKLVRKIQDSPIGYDLAKDLVLQGRQKALMRRIIQEEVIPTIDTPDPLPVERIKERMLELVDQKTEEQEYYPFTARERKHFDPDMALPTGLDRIDRGLKGGLFPGELGLICGAPEEGKTLSAINFSIPALILGHKVYYFTLDEQGEDIAKRFDLRITGKSSSDLPAKIKYPSYIDNLFIIDKSWGCRIEDITGFIHRHGPPGLLIIDAGDLLTPAVRRKDKRPELGEIYQSYLRVSRQFNIPVWVTTQATVRSMEYGRKKLIDLSEAKLEKSSVVSVILFLVKTDDANIIKVSVGKARRPPGARWTYVNVNRATQHMEGRE